MPAVPLVELVARRERHIVLAALAAVTLLGFFATLYFGDMLMMTDASGAGYVVLLFVMWWTMMLAMMLPSAAPAILTFAALARKFSQRHTGVASPFVFATGYALLWTAFSTAAVGLQLFTSSSVPLTMMMAVINPMLGAALLIAAGLYQLSPLKAACLRKCQTPLIFLGQNWQPGAVGALRMGLQHGLYCVGCCWVLMGLLFYGGVMEPRWIIGLALYVGVEKLMPAGNRLSRLSGMLLILWGGVTVATGLS